MRRCIKVWFTFANGEDKRRAGCWWWWGVTKIFKWLERAFGFSTHTREPTHALMHTGAL